MFKTGWMAVVVVAMAVSAPAVAQKMGVITRSQIAGLSAPAKASRVLDAVAANVVATKEQELVGPWNTSPLQSRWLQSVNIDLQPRFDGEDDLCVAQRLIVLFVPLSKEAADSPFGHGDLPVKATFVQTENRYASPGFLSGALTEPEPDCSKLDPNSYFVAEHRGEAWAALRMFAAFREAAESGESDELAKFTCRGEWRIPAGCADALKVIPRIKSFSRVISLQQKPDVWTVVLVVGFQRELWLTVTRPNGRAVTLTSAELMLMDPLPRASD